MISKTDFIQSVRGKKEFSQRYFVRLARCIFNFIPFNFKKYQKPVSDYIYMTICRKQDFDMVLVSLYTLFKFSDLQPKKVVIVSDGSWKSEDGLSYFRKYGLQVECSVWAECASYYQQECPSLTRWAEKHIWGKKMVAILYYSESEHVLFSDPDILWFNTPFTKEEIQKIKFKVSVDNSHNYDDKCIQDLGFNELYDREPINCGVIYMHGGLAMLNNEALLCINYEAEHIGPFAEQTVFALMDKKYDCRWTMQQITSEIDDLISPLWSKTIFYDGMIARHYLWRLKWIYWKDLIKKCI